MYFSQMHVHPVYLLLIPAISVGPNSLSHQVQSRSEPPLRENVGGAC